MIRILVLLLMLTPLPAVASGLPPWALAAMAESEQVAAPKGADAWVLLDRTEYLLGGGGEVKIRRFRVVKVLTPAGRREGAYVLSSLGGRSGKVEKLVGWNRTPGGELHGVDKDDVLTLDPDGDLEVTSRVATTAVLPGVVPGSILAFESRERTLQAWGPVFMFGVAERNPILRWEMVADHRWYLLGEGHPRIEVRNLDGWGEPSGEASDGLLRVLHVPADRGERGGPGWLESRPVVSIVFPSQTGASQAFKDWGALGIWVSRMVKEKAVPPEDLPDFPGEGPRRVAGLRRWMARNFYYQSVHLTPDRSIVPMPPSRVMRARGGDCKDLTAFLVGAAGRMGFRVHPVLARVEGGRIRAGDPVNPALFDHMVGALELEASLGLAAEITAGGTRYLLIDPTWRVGAFGDVPPSLAGKLVLVCTPQGGHLVRVPEAAAPRIEILVEARAGEGGDLEGSLVLKETRGALGLAGAQLEGGREGLSAALRAQLGLPGHALVEATSQGDPLAEDGPFVVEARWSLTDGWRVEGDRAALVLPGLPKTPVAVQVHGVPRRSGLRFEARPSLHWEARLQLPEGWRPARARGEETTALAHLTWSGEGGSGIRLCLDWQGRMAEWPAERGAEGVQAHEDHRATLARILEDLCTFSR